MKRPKFSEQQIAYAPSFAEAGTSVADVCRRIGVTEATYCTWKKKFGDLGVLSSNYGRCFRTRMACTASLAIWGRRYRLECQVDLASGGT